MQEGLAATWANTLLEQCLDQETYPEYTKFKAMMEKSFKPVMLTEKARTKLDSVQQGTRSVEEYNIEFGMLMADANLEDKMELIRMYRRGLKPAIRNRIEDLPMTTGLIL